ncbi:MAG: hypothetical protein R3B84_15835 [Zavarzinella sp.]
MNDQNVQVESEFIFRRLAETFKIYGSKSEYSGTWWLLILGVVLFLAVAFVIMKYIRDARSVRWYWATPLAILRLSVYAILAIMFLLPAKQDYEKSEKRSRVIIVLDVSGSMANVSDDVTTSNSSANRTTRLQKVVDFLLDDANGFMQNLSAKNPVYIYRVGSRLDEEVQTFERNASNQLVPVYRAVAADGSARRVQGNAWTKEEWRAFASYDFKPWLTRGLSNEGIQQLAATAQWDGEAPGTADWAQQWFDAKDAAIPTTLAPEDKATLERNRDKLMGRIEVYKTIGSATNIPDGVTNILNREGGNMVYGMIIFSDGQNNFGGGENSISDLRLRAKREKVPVFTVGIGSQEKVISVRITDLSAPEQTPPDDPFKIIVEVDGDGLLGKKAPVNLEVLVPGAPEPIKLPSELVYKPGEPPHGTAEFVIDPANVPDVLRAKDEAACPPIHCWKPTGTRATTPSVKGERYAEKEHVTDWQILKVQKRPLRILLCCSAPNRDFQFLLTQLIRDKADLSVFVQNDGGTGGKINLMEDAERQLTRFPDKFFLDDAAVPPEDKWYNLNRYDAIISFDLDWTALTAEQIRLVFNWVNTQGGGLMFVAGHIHTEEIVRPDPENKFKPLLNILPVIPGDPQLAAARRETNKPWRLEFKNIAGDMDFLKIDDTLPIEVAWERYFTGNDTRTDTSQVIRGFYNYFPVADKKPVATTIATFPDPDAIKLPDGSSPPWLAVMKYGEGRTAWVGNPELWRLRRYKAAYSERFWTKFTRYLSIARMRKKTSRGTPLFGGTYTIDGPLSVRFKLFDANAGPLAQNSEPRVVLRPINLEKYPPEIERLVGEEQIAAAKAKYHDKFAQEVRMSARKVPDATPDAWDGIFERRLLLNPQKFAAGVWRAEAEVPGTTEMPIGKFVIKESNPEVDNTMPNFKDLYLLASDVSEVKNNVQDQAVWNTISSSAGNGAEGQRLTFRFTDEEAVKKIPDCISSNVQTLRNKGAIEDYWDRGVTLPSFMTSWMTDKPMRVGLMLLIVVGLLSLEWMTRKLLKLA